MHPAIALEPAIAPPPSRARTGDGDAAIVELLRGRLTLTGPTTADALAQSLQIDVKEADAALLALEGKVSSCAVSSSERNGASRRSGERVQRA